MICYYWLFKQDGKNALIRSSENGHKEIVEMLLKMPNFDINIQDEVYDKT